MRRRLLGLKGIGKRNSQRQQNYSSLLNLHLSLLSFGFFDCARSVAGDLERQLLVGEVLTAVHRRWGLLYFNFLSVLANSECLLFWNTRTSITPISDSLTRNCATFRMNMENLNTCPSFANSRRALTFASSAEPKASRSCIRFHNLLKGWTLQEFPPLHPNKACFGRLHNSTLWHSKILHLPRFQSQGRFVDSKCSLISDLQLLVFVASIDCWPFLGERTAGSFQVCRTCNSDADKI